MTRPRILLIGAGRFGQVHLKTLKQLERRGEVKLAGVVVRQGQTQKKIAELYRVPVYTKLDVSLLRTVDAVDIVTPRATHAALIQKCLPYCHVIVEKPLADNAHEAQQLVDFSKKQKHLLMVGHIYRFDPTVQWLKKYISRKHQVPATIEGRLLNPQDGDPIDDVKLELFHFFDIMDFLFGKRPVFSSEVPLNNHTVVYLQYPGNCYAHFELGLAGDKKIRTLDLHFSAETLHCDLARQRVEIWRKGRIERIIDLAAKPRALEPELLHFLAAVRGKAKEYPDATLGKKIIDIVKSIRPPPKKRKPTIAVIGGGIFGATIAAELGGVGEVSLFEQHDDVLTEASLVNQNRHHWGYHYPLSDQTVEQCRRARLDFMNTYGSAVVKVPSYYAISEPNTVVSGKKYLQFCERNELPVRKEYPGEFILAKKRFRVCVKTPEAVYNYTVLKHIARKRLLDEHVKLHLNSRVVGGRLMENGQKLLIIRKKGKRRHETFDFVINATYFRGNQFAQWFGFPVKPLYFALKEILLLRLPVANISATIWMGNDFGSIVATEKEGIHTFVYMPASKVKRLTPVNGLAPQWGKTKSKWNLQLQKGRKWFPILSKAEYLGSRFMTLGVDTENQKKFARTADSIAYGFGCWSVLGGKIITCVSTAKELAKQIRNAGA